MARYVALIDGKRGAYGVVFPDRPGCTAMGRSVDEAIRNAGEALAEWVGDERQPAGRFPLHARSRRPAEIRTSPKRWPMALCWR